MRLARYALLSALFALSAPAQNITGSFTGSVTDPSGAAVAGAEVTATNAETNQPATVKTSDQGVYQLLYLRPGPYSIRVTAAGFKTTLRDNIRLVVEDRVRVDFVLEIGEATTTISVKEEIPLVESQTASLGQVISARSVQELPIRGRNVFDLVGLAPGVQTNIRALGDVASTGTNAAPLFVFSDMSINGGRFRTNDFMLDGVTIMLPENNNYAISPTPDGTQEFKVQTNAYGPEFGRSGGGVVNVLTRGGGNAFHGSVYEFFRNDRLRANNYFANARNQKRGIFHYNQFGVAAGGAIKKDRTFFFAEYQGHREDTSFAGRVLTIPAAAQRAGDFSDVRATNGQPITIYDPFSTQPSAGGGFRRQPFAGNVIPQNRIDRAAARMAAFLPNPNLPGEGPARVNNWAFAPSNATDDDQYSIRIDQRISDKHSIFGRVTRNMGESRNTGEFGTIADNSLGNIKNRVLNSVVNGTYLLSPTRILSYRAGATRRFEGRQPINQGKVDIAALGFPASMASAFDSKFAMFPTIATGYATFGMDGGDPIRRGNTIYTLVADASEVRGPHTFKAGADFRLYDQTPLQGWPVGHNYSFGRGQTQGPDPLQQSLTAGDGFASFLTGFGAGSIRNTPALAIRNLYWAAFFNDEIKLGKLTVNLGLRYEIEHPRRERYDRFASFDFNRAFPITAPGVSNLKGVLTHPGRDGLSRSQTETSYTNWGPRIGLAYAMNPKTVIRAGYGIFYSPLWGTTSAGGFGVTGEEISTDWLSSIDGVTPVNPLSNPFPSGFLQPLTTQAGLLQLGQNLNIIDRGNKSNAYTQQWNFGVQREIPGNMVIEIAYAANKGTRLPGAFEFNQLDPRFQSLGQDLNARVTNPFFGLVTTGGLSASTVARGQLLRPYPHYLSVSNGNPSRWQNAANSIYHSLTVRAEKRFTHGINFVAAYTRGKAIDEATGRIFGVNQAVTPQNSYNLRAERALSEGDVKNRFVLNHTVDLPFGKGKRFGRTAPRALDLLVGGWSASGQLTLVSGFPLALASTGNSGVFSGRLRPNTTGNSAELSGPIQQRLSRYFDTSQFSIPQAFTFGNLGRTLNVRGPALAAYDIALSKRFLVREPVAVLFRIESFNLTNTPFFGGANTPFGNPGQTLGNPDFGVISVSRNERQFQASLKVQW
jgi:hypothetical protein